MTLHAMLLVLESFARRTTMRGLMDTLYVGVGIVVSIVICWHLFVRFVDLLRALAHGFEYGYWDAFKEDPDLWFVLFVVSLMVLAIGLLGAWWLWPLTGIVVLVPSLATLLLRLRSQPWRERKPIISLALSAVSGGVVAFQIVEHGMPVGWWLVPSAVCLLGLQIAIGVCGEAALTHKILCSLRGSVAAAAIGVLLVVATQVVLAYCGDIAPDHVRSWLRLLAGIRDWLHGTVLLDPGVLIAILVALLAVVAVFPALNVIRSYRRVSRVASLGLLLVTVATNFTFFTARHSGSWEGAWTAKRGTVLAAELAELDANRAETIGLTAIEDAFESMPVEAQADLRAYAEELLLSVEGEVEADRGVGEVGAAVHVDARPPPNANSARITAHSRVSLNEIALKLTARVQMEAITSRVAIATTSLQRTSSSPSGLKFAPPQRSSAPPDLKLVDTRQRLRAPQLSSLAKPGPALRIDQLDSLAVERTRAQALKREAYAAAVQALAVILPPVLAEPVAHVLMGKHQVDFKPAGINGSVDRQNVKQAMHSSAVPPPAVWLSGLGRGSLEPHVNPAAPANVPFPAVGIFHPHIPTVTAAKLRKEPTLKSNNKTNQPWSSKRSRLGGSGQASGSLVAPSRTADVGVDHRRPGNPRVPEHHRTGPRRPPGHK